MSAPHLTTKDLKSVNKPAQYLGGEVGSVMKNDKDVDFHFCLAFPDVYEVGMSHLGMQILYSLVNSDPKAWAERAYVPYHDMEALLRSKRIPLSSLESKRPLKEFDLIGFSLQYELSATGVLSILDLAGIPFRSKDRDNSHPLIIGGGPVSYHPEPFADFFDIFMIGDGEEAVPALINELRIAKRSKLSRDETLQRVAKLKGIYVPSFFIPKYNDAGRFIDLKPRFDWYQRVERNVLASLENAPYPAKPIVPNIKAVHDRLSIEVMRGCVRGCRFCQAGYLYRPQRERKPEDILKIVEETIPNSGYEELSLLSLSTADYCSILPLLSSIKERYCQDDNLVVSFPSTRVDALKPELLSEVQSIRRSGFTIAPEAGTQRLRDVINKGVTDEEIIETCTNVFNMGWDHIKMYFMIGLPTETDDDILGIINIAKRVKALAKKGKQSLIVSVSTHVPKPHTPFQWAEQITEGETLRKQKILYLGLKKIGVQFRYHKAYSTFLEGVFARGDRKLSYTLERAYDLGCRLDGWVEEIKREHWEQAFQETDIDPLHYLHARPEDSCLPWDHISCDISKRYFLKEWGRATAARVTPDCLTESCSVCGACNYDSKRNVLFDRQRTESRLNIINPPWQSIIDQRAARTMSDNNPKVAEISGEVLPDVISSKVELPESQPEFGSGSLDYIPPKEGIDFPFQHPSKPVVIHENVEHTVGYGLQEMQKHNPLNKPEKRAIQRIRVSYEKKGVFKFTGHLELASLIFRITRRLKLPIAFSRGFSPKPKIIFGPPLQLGVESSCELVDLFLTETVEPSTIVERCNSILPPGLKFVSASEIPLKTKSLQETIEVQRFKVKPNIEADLRDNPFKSSSDWANKVVVRKGKDGKTRDIALRSAVTSISIDQGQAEFDLLMSQNSVTLRPSEVVEALTDLDSNNFDLEKISVEMRD